MIKNQIIYQNFERDFDPNYTLSSHVDHAGKRIGFLIRQRSTKLIKLICDLKENQIENIMDVSLGRVFDKDYGRFDETAFEKLTDIVINNYQREVGWRQ